MSRALAGLLLALLVPACSSAAAPEAGWSPAPEAVSDSSSHGDEAEAQSLGSPFLLAADRLVEPDGVQQAHVVLTSDACEVVLSSLSVVIGPDDGSRTAAAPILLVAAQPATGRVTASGPHSLHAEFALSLMAFDGEQAEGAPSSQVEATATLEAVELSGSALTSFHISLQDGVEGRLLAGASIDVKVLGAFTGDDAAIPQRRAACW